MLTVRMAKSKLENEEGMNHLWVQFKPIGNVENARIQIILPCGLFRNHNLSSFYENEAGEIVIFEPNVSDGFFIEVYTREPVSCGINTIVVILAYNNEEGEFFRFEHIVPLEIVEEDDMNDVNLDEAVVTRIKELYQDQLGNSNQNLNVFNISKKNSLHPEQSSDLEKKYRIDGEVTLLKTYHEERELTINGDDLTFIHLS